MRSLTPLLGRSRIRSEARYSPASRCNSADIEMIWWLSQLLLLLFLTGVIVIAAVVVDVVVETPVDFSSSVSGLKNKKITDE